MALAQKLSIRLGRHFTQGKLVEISTQSLHSKWFGQSGKLVSKMFDEIHSLAEDEESLICVLIDEVESLTSSRERSAQSNECNDAMRARRPLNANKQHLPTNPHPRQQTNSSPASTAFASAPTSSSSAPATSSPPSTPPSSTAPTSSSSSRHPARQPSTRSCGPH